MPEANRLRAQLISSRTNYGSAHLSVLGVYYPDASVFITDSALYTPDMMDYYTMHDTDVSLLVRATANARNYAVILEDGKCWIIRTIYSRGEAYAYVLLRFDLPEFCREHLKEGDVLCILKNGGICYSSSADLALDAVPDGSGAGTARAGKQTYYYKTTAPAGLSGVTILSLVNAEPYNREVMTFIQRFVLILGGGVLVMILLAYVFTSRIFLPVRRLLTNLVSMEAPDAPSLSSTVDSVTSYVNNLSTETEGYRQAARADEYILLGNRLHQLIFFPEEELEEETGKFRRDAGLSTEGSLTVTSILYDPEAVASMQVGASMLKYFYLETARFFREKLTGVLPYQLVKYTYHYVLLTDCRGEEDRARINDLLEKLNGIFLRDHRIEVLNTGVRIVRSAGELREVLMNVRSDMENSLFWRGQAESPSEASARKNSPYVKQAFALAMLLSRENYQKACETADNLLNALLAESGNYRYAMFRLNGLLSIAIFSLRAENPALPDPDDISFASRLYAARNYQAVKEELHTIIDEMIVLNETEKDGTPTILDEMVRYINENYASQGLSLGTLATVFQLSESAISRVFRQHMDMTALEYIQKFRVYKAKELLTDHSVKDTALAVGFWDTQALIRVFKKYEGITPGQYKESAEKRTRIT